MADALRCADAAALRPAETGRGEKTTVPIRLTVQSPKRSGGLFNVTEYYASNSYTFSMTLSINPYSFASSAVMK